MAIFNSYVKLPEGKVGKGKVAGLKTSSSESRRPAAQSTATTWPPWKYLVYDGSISSEQHNRG